ncbi:MAG: hypothetical protein HQK96_01330 [Nitrospirae bacterium]|nr:hypothetical protein [Nitrospirota bacterium]
MYRKIKTASVGGIFFLANALLTTSGCSPELKDCPPQFANTATPLQKYGVITEVQEVEQGQFKIVSEVPSKCSGVMVTHIDGAVEIIPQQQAETMIRDAPNDFGLGLGTVLASGLFGYMLGRTYFISSHVYANDSIYRQTLANKAIITRKTGRDDSPQYSLGGGRYGGLHGGGIEVGGVPAGGRYGGRESYGKAGTGMKRGGFFSALFGRSSG